MSQPGSLSIGTCRAWRASSGLDRLNRIERYECFFLVTIQGHLLNFAQGTWQFRSALSLHYPRKPYRSSDDIESFLYAYLYLILRYHKTRVSSVRDAVMSLFEQVSLVGGVRIGGDAKLHMIGSGKPTFSVESNIPLQNLVLKLIRGCSLAYSQIDFEAMERLYGPDRTVQSASSLPSNSDSDSSPPRTRGAFRARARARRMDSDDEMSEAPDDDVVEKALELSGDEDGAHPPGAMLDVCTPGSFLTHPRNMTKLFVQHSEDAVDIDDKARDQFLARRHEDVRVVPERMTSRGIATLSVTGSSPSVEGLPEGIPEYDQFGADPTPSVATTPPSSSPNQGTKKRGRFQPSSDAEDVSSMDSEEERRRVKRVKGKGKARGKARGARS